MILSDRDIRALLRTGRIIVDPLGERAVQPSSVDLRVAASFRVFANHRYPFIDVRAAQPDLTELVKVEDGEPFILHPGEFVLGSTYERVALPDDLVARLEGKALALRTPVPTPSGWTTMGEVQVGDSVFDELGRPCPVVAATEVLFGRPCREVVFSDGQTIVTDALHQWETWSEDSHRHRTRVVTSAEVQAALRARAACTHHVRLAEAVRYPPKALPTDPYALGLLGGDHVPPVYLQGSVEQRTALLRGLMDRDGATDSHGRRAFTAMREGLADAVVELAASLGFCPVKSKAPAMLGGIERGPQYTVTFTPRRSRVIVEVRDVPSVPVRCIQVASPRGLFLVGPTFIPTHNSSLGRLGLLVHATAGFVDPGFDGALTLELSNVSNLPIAIYAGMAIGQVAFFRLSSPAEQPYGARALGSKYQGQRGPTASRYHEDFRGA